MAKNNYVITGSIGAGKSTFVSKLKERGFPVIECDNIVHHLYNAGNEGYNLIRDYVGAEYVNENEVDRKKLKVAINDDISIIKKLETLIHPIVIKEVESMLTKDVNFIDIPLYFENKEVFTFPHKTICVWATREQQLERVKARDNSIEEDIMKIMDLQIDTDSKKEMADYVVDNSGAVGDLDFEVESLLKELKIKKIEA